MTFQAEAPSLNKKEAKAAVAKHALLQMGYTQALSTNNFANETS